jgi:hypothetical protein
MKSSYRKHIFLTSFILTIAVFGAGMILSYLLDFARIDEINKVIQTHELDSEAYLLQQDFLNQFGGSQCEQIQQRLTTLKEEVRRVGIDLSNYGSKGFFKKKDYDYLKRKYFLLELQFLNLADQANRECGQTYTTILFFYKIDDNPSERQGYILDDINDAFKDRIAVMSIDKDYADEPLIKLLASRFNVTSAPTIIIGDDVRFDRLVYTGELNATVIRLLKNPDEYGRHLNFDYVINATATNKSRLVETFKDILSSNISEFAKGDLLLALGRLTSNGTLICSSLQHYDKYMPATKEEKALLYETFAAVGCGRNKRAFLLEASRIWNELGNKARSAIDQDLADKKKIKPEFGVYNFSGQNIAPEQFSTVTIGGKSLIITKSDRLLSQVDRVNRDWLSGQLNESPFSMRLLTVFSERNYLPREDLWSDIGWHEGARIAEIEKIGLPRDIAVGTMVVRSGNKWYAPNEKGVFMFEVPSDKLLYPTTRFLTGDVAVIIDTHGANMLVEQAFRYNSTVVVACCDSPAKVAAASYLAERGIKVLCFTDKYLPLLLGKNASILGSPPIRRNGNTVVAGAQPLTIRKSEVIVVEDIASNSALHSYYDTPARYFRLLGSHVPLKTSFFNISSQTYELTSFARSLNATVVAARVYTIDDYRALKDWLANKNHKAILFHSSSYPYGLKLLLDYPNQTTFDDISPVFR